VEKDYEEAAKWWRKATDQNNPDAQFKLGVLYSSGRGVEKNEEEAVELYRRAAEQNISEAQLKLGVMYYSGRGGGAKDILAAYAWCKIAATNGNTDAKCYKDNITMKLTPEQISEAETFAKELLNKIAP
jgi:TPR repeat protein